MEACKGCGANSYEQLSFQKVACEYCGNVYIIPPAGKNVVKNTTIIGSGNIHIGDISNTNIIIIKK